MAAAEPLHTENRCIRRTKARTIHYYYIITMAEKRYFYRFAMTSGLGVRFRGFWNMCQRANRAADTFAKKVGARMFYPDMRMVAGGVDAVVFPEGEKVDRRIWRSAGKDGDGMELWVPDVKKRRGEIALKEGERVPSHTASRVFDKRPAADATGGVAFRDADAAGTGADVGGGTANRTVGHLPSLDEAEGVPYLVVEVTTLFAESLVEEDVIAGRC
jgi:hypothetical protein